MLKMKLKMSASLNVDFDISNSVKSVSKCACAGMYVKIMCDIRSERNSTPLYLKALRNPKYSYMISTAYYR